MASRFAFNFFATFLKATQIEGARSTDEKAPANKPKMMGIMNSLMVETDMNTSEKIKKVLAIAFSLLMGNGLLITLQAIFPTQLKAILPTNGNYRSYAIEAIGALITVGLIFLFKKIIVLKIT